MPMTSLLLPPLPSLLPTAWATGEQSSEQTIATQKPDHYQPSHQSHRRQSPFSMATQRPLPISTINPTGVGAPFAWPHNNQTMTNPTQPSIPQDTEPFLHGHTTAITNPHRQSHRRRSPFCTATLRSNSQLTHLTAGPVPMGTCRCAHILATRPYGAPRCLPAWSTRTFVLSRSCRAITEHC